MKKFIAAVLLVFFFCTAWGEERITQFVSQVRVDERGTALVQEDISILAEHKNIRRGIYRDLPNSKKEPVRVLSLKMDGEPHPYFIERNGDFLRVNFGNDDYIAQGPHTYRLTYEIKNVVRFFPQYDEIYWNVTGNEWVFPIERAVFELTLPQGAQVDEERISSYIGHYGQKGDPAVREQLVFWTPFPLSARMGLTVAVPWQKGIVQEPEPSWWEKHQNNIVWFLMGLPLLILWAFYWWAWNRVGRDPHAKVIRQFDPPEGFSAAQTSCVYYMDTGRSVLAVCLTSLAVKGALEIREEKSFFSGSHYTLVLKNKEAPMLSLEEEKVLNALFANGRTQVVMAPESYFIFRSAQETLSDSLHQQIGNRYFVSNWKYNWPTIAALFLWILLAGVDIFSVLALMFGLTIMTVTTFWIGTHKKTWPHTLCVWVLIAILGWLAFFILKGTDCSVALWVGLMGICIPGGLFAYLIRSYTKLGRLVMDQIEGFREYLEIGEGGRVEMSNPQDVAQIFCDYLPYAYALGVQSKWMQAFKNRLDDSSLTQAMHNRGLMLSNAGEFNSAMASITAAGRPISSSSGSGGGGFSGGGSGGGGGGGR